MAATNGQHVHAVDGQPVGALDYPNYLSPNQVVRVAESDVYGRVRLLWRCCSTAVVQHLDSPDARYAFAELLPPAPGVTYSVPCVGSDWSLTLPCGHLAGEGCDCDTIALEAQQGDDDGDPRYYVADGGSVTDY